MVSLFTWISIVSAQSNEGTEFWMGFMEKFELGEEERVLLITSRFDTEGIIRIPLQGWQTEFDVEANEIIIIEIPESAVPKGSETITNTGIQITSKDPIVVYAHQYETNRAEASAVLPVSSLGTVYYTIGYQGYSRVNPLNNELEEYPSEFIVVATDNNTNISVVVSDETLGGLQAGEELLIQLNRGETFQIQASGGDEGDLSGSRITSNKPIAVFSGNLWTQVPNGCNARDNIYEQMYPTQTWGKRFIAIPQTQVDFSILRILASNDITQINLSGDINSSITLDEGTWSEFTHASPVYIESTQPIMIAQFSVGRDCNGHPNTLGDPSMVLINSIEQTRDTVTFFASPFKNIEENYVNVIVRTEDVGQVILDGTPLDGLAPFNIVPSLPDFSFTSVQVEAGSHTLTAEGCGLNASIYGYGEAESYAYAAGAFFRAINPEKLKDLTGGCTLDTLIFDSGLSSDIFLFEWDFGDGNTSNLPIPRHIYQDPGIYLLTLSITNICLNNTETFRQPLILNEKPQLVSSNDTIVCQGQPVFLATSNITGASYEWEGPDGFSSQEPLPTITSMRPTLEGNFFVQATVNSCTSEWDSVLVELYDSPEPDLGKDTVICPGDTFTRTPGIFPAVLWQDGSTNRTYNIVQSGMYWVETSNAEGCSNIDSLLVTEACPVEMYIPSAFSPNGDGINDEFKVFAENLSSYQLRIYNRWGKQIYVASQVGNGWDGTQIDGSYAPEGVYIWTITFEGISRSGNTFTQIRSGTITLIR